MRPGAVIIPLGDLNICGYIYEIDWFLILIKKESLEFI